jgi:hypothetical protein
MRKVKNSKKERMGGEKEPEKEGRFDEEPEEERRTRDEDVEEKDY